MNNYLQELGTGVLTEKEEDLVVQAQKFSMEVYNEQINNETMIRFLISMLSDQAEEIRHLKDSVRVLHNIELNKDT